MDDNNTSVQCSEICKKLLAVKIGCSTLLQQDDKFSDEDKEEEYDSDEEVDDDNKKEGRRTPRASQYKWALSQIAPMKYSAFKCDGMFYEESLQHTKYSDAWICGEWYGLSEDEIEGSMEGRHGTNGRWERKRQGGVSKIDATIWTKWTNTKLITDAEVLRRMDKGTTKAL